MRSDPRFQDLLRRMNFRHDAAAPHAPTAHEAPATRAGMNFFGERSETMSHGSPLLWTTPWTIKGGQWGLEFGYHFGAHLNQYWPHSTAIDSRKLVAYWPHK